MEKAKKKLLSSFLLWKHPLKDVLERKQSQTEEERSLFDPSSAIWSILAQFFLQGWFPTWPTGIKSRTTWSKFIPGASRCYCNEVRGGTQRINLATCMQDTAAFPTVPSPATARVYCCQNSWSFGCVNHIISLEHCSR